MLIPYQDTDQSKSKKKNFGLIDAYRNSKLYRELNRCEAKYESGDLSRGSDLTGGKPFVIYGIDNAD